MANGLSLREFGRQLDVTGEAVRKAIKTGRIPADCIEHDDKGWPRIVDADRAAKAWGRDRDPTQVRDKATMSAAAKRGWSQRRAATAEALPAPPGERSGADSRRERTGGRGRGRLPTITDSKEVLEYHKAEMAKIEHARLLGTLVNAEQVKAKFIGMVTTAKTRLMGVPSKAKARIPTLTVRDIEALEDLIAEALEELSIGGR